MTNYKAYEEGRLICSTPYAAIVALVLQDCACDTAKVVKHGNRKVWDDSYVLGLSREQLTSRIASKGR